ncbi:MAG: M23 family metallopeptidase [Clostridia bacterium]|nr:M23 family metallopeptidase [Clostridia bacterium]
MKNWKESEFFKKLKAVRVNRAVYLCAIVILLSLSVVLAVTVATNRANKGGTDELPSDNTTVTPPDTDPGTDETPGDSEPTINDQLPELVLPVSGTLCKKHSVDTQVFSPTMNDYRVHLGIDISTEASAPVCAVADGTVAQLWEDPMMGWCVALDHTGECVTVYKNLAKDFAEGIEVGATVLEGQLLGHVGDTAMMEIAEEPHLHMEMTVKGLQVDPLEYFSEAVLSTLTEDSIYEAELGK